MALASFATALAVTLSAANPAAARYAAIVMEADTGRVLYEVNADTRNHPASLTKMMTLYMLFAALEAGHLTLDDKLKVSRRAANMPASRLGLKRGQSIRVEDAILALVTKSANDVAVVAAEALGGSEKEFALLMTEKAKALGMSRSKFRNASGLYNKGQLSTARDMAILSQALIRDFPERYKLFATESFSYNGRRYRNHNRLLRNFDGADGLKTGYIAAAGYNLAASAKRDGHRVIAVLFGGKSSRSRNRQVAKLLTQGFRQLTDPIYMATGGAPEKDVGLPLAKPLTLAKAYLTKSSEPEPATRAYAADRIWGVQVGAFYAYKPAKKAAETAMARLPKLLSGTDLAITNVRGERGKIYRARLFGLTEVHARKACKQLTAMKTDCLVVQNQKRLHLAQSQ